MNILYVWDADYPWDVRVEKICSSLAGAGHKVNILARNLKKRPAEELIGDITVHRLRSFNNATLNYALSFPLFFSPVWLARMRAIARERKIELIIVRDLPMAIAAIWVARACRIPVVFDMAEDYVSMIREIWDNARWQGLNLVVRNPYLARLVERYVMKRVDHTLVVVEEMKEVVAEAGGDLQTTSIVGNTPPLQAFEAAANCPAALLPHKERYKAIYTGGLEPMRGLHTMIDALPEIIAAIPEFMFVVVGAGNNRTALEKRADLLGVGEQIAWLGWVEHKQLPLHIRECQVGVIPHIVSRHVDTTIPNKLFDYMGCGLPVVASDARPMRRVLEGQQAGVVFRSGDARDLARAIISLYREPGTCAQNGLRAVATGYNWKLDEERLLRAISSFAPGQASKTSPS